MSQRSVCGLCESVVTNQVQRDIHPQVETWEVAWCCDERRLWGQMASTHIPDSSPNSFLPSDNFINRPLFHILSETQSIPPLDDNEDVWPNQLIPCCQLHLKAPVVSPPLSAWLSFSLLTKNMPKLNKFPINFQPWLHLIGKLGKCLLLTQMADDHETPSQEEKCSIPLVQSCFSLGCLLFSHSVKFNSLPLCMPGLPALHYCPELAQIHVHWVGNVIQPSHLLSSPSPPAFNLSQHQSLF